MTMTKFWIGELKGLGFYLISHSILSLVEMAGPKPWNFYSTLNCICKFTCKVNLANRKTDKIQLQYNNNETIEETKECCPF